MRRALAGAVFLLAMGVFVIVVGPRVRIDLSAKYALSRPLDGPLEALPGVLADYESAVGDVHAGAEKRVIWNDGPKKTAMALVYLHGFSASRQETAPFTEMLARALGANAFETRLSGHGRRSDALGDATATQWLKDTAEAITIGERIGERVVLIGVSTGGTLAALATEIWPDRIDGLVLISPNFGVADPSARILGWPWGHVVLPRIIPRRSWKPDNEQHGTFWTTDYRTDVLFEMHALLLATREIDWSTRRSPALFIGSPKDEVVDFKKTRSVIARWPASLREVHEVEVPPGHSAHVLAGDILNPTLTTALVDRTRHFLEGRLAR